MDTKELRGLIRSSLEGKIKEIQESRRRIPTSLSDFSQLIKESLEDSSCEDVDFEKVYDLWENMILETESNEDWNDSLHFYVSQSDFSNAAARAILKKLKR